MSQEASNFLVVRVVRIKLRLTDLQGNFDMKYKCDLCPQSFDTLQKLRSHEKKRGPHSKPPSRQTGEFFCNTPPCISKSFSKEYSLGRHYREYHSTVRLLRLKTSLTKLEEIKCPCHQLPFVGKLALQAHYQHESQNNSTVIPSSEFETQRDVMAIDVFQEPELTPKDVSSTLIHGTRESFASDPVIMAGAYGYTPTGGSSDFYQDTHSLGSQTLPLAIHRQDLIQPSTYPQIDEPFSRMTADYRSLNYPIPEYPDNLQITAEYRPLNCSQQMIVCPEENLQLIGSLQTPAGLGDHSQPVSQMESAPSFAHLNPYQSSTFSSADECRGPFL
ncbi:MAG: hypothetical protein M1839_005363 [Geoglossum umbratile]|nr:MAG: hypothetical protein M1839_005363 [Geoglossum umbratile]